MSSVITVTEAVRSFSDVIGRVHYKHESFTIKKGNHIVAKLTPVDAQSLAVAELNNFFAQSPKLTSEDLDAFEQDVRLIQTVLNTFEDSWA